MKKSDPDWDLRNLWRAVAPATVRPAVRRIVQKLDFGWRACDGPSCHSVTKFRESIFQYPISDFLSVLKRDPATVRRPMTVHRGVRCFCQFFQNWSLLLKTTKQVVTLWEQIPGGIPIMSAIDHPIALLNLFSTFTKLLTCCSFRSDAMITGTVSPFPKNS